jgi:hypothetical protein
VIHRPETERLRHCFTDGLPDHFEAILHFDVTRAVESPQRTGVWDAGKIAQTCPMGL